MNLIPNLCEDFVHLENATTLVNSKWTFDATEKET